MALINSNKPDGDGNLAENVHHLRSPSQSSVSSEELLIWSKVEGNDCDWELFSKVPPCNGEFGRVQNPLNIESENSFIAAAYRHSDNSNDVSRSITVTEVNSSSSFNNNSCTTIHSSNNHNFPTLPLSASPSTSQSCLHYMNGSTKGQLIHSTKTKMTKTTFSGLLPSSSLSTTSKSKNVTIDHCTSSNNLPEQRNINMLADDFIDLDIKINPALNSSIIPYHPDIDCVSLQESPILSSQNSLHNKKLLPLSLSICNNSVNIQKSNVIFQSPETDSIKQTSPNPQFVECHNNSTFTNCGYIRNVNSKSDNNNNNNSSHYQSFESVDHFILDNNLNDDASSYLFLSTSSSSSASSCIHIPSTCNDSTTTTTTTTTAAATTTNNNNNNNSCCADCHVENNALSTSTINRMLVNGEENDNHCHHHRYHEGPSVHHQYQRQDSELIRLTMHNCIPLPIMLIPTSELASGDSLTCTVVNILRGLGLLDRCGVEDLCASLYDFWDNNFHIPSHPVHSFFKSLMYPTCWESSRIEESVVTRSSSFTSCTLVDSRRSTVPSENYERNYQMLINCRGSKPLHGSCLVNYLLSCSYMGTSFLASHSIYDLNNFSSHYCLRSSTSCCYFAMDRINQMSSYNTSTIYHPSLAQPIYNSTMDWRRGCADNLVLMLTHHCPGSKSSSSVVDKLLTGRFFPGPISWRSVWPMHRNNRKCFGSTNSKCNNICNSLALWFSSWLYCGAIPVLAQLTDSTICPNEQCYFPDVTQPNCKSPNHSSQELVWCHRLVYGVTENNEVYLTNPNELVPVQYVLDQLSKKPEIRISKAQISNLWTKHYLHSKLCADRDQIAEDKQQNTSCKSTFFTGESLTLLARHPDPRWASMNIMGQVLCALRSLERWADTLELPTTTSPDSVNYQSVLFHDITSSSFVNSSRSNSADMEQFSNSSAIIIPSAQLPGISLFVEKCNWELVHTLLYNNCIE